MRYRVKSHGPLRAVRTQPHKESARGRSQARPGHHRMMIAPNLTPQRDLGVSQPAGGDGR